MSDPDSECASIEADSLASLSDEELRHGPYLAGDAHEEEDFDGDDDDVAEAQKNTPAKCPAADQLSSVTEVCLPPFPFFSAWFVSLLFRVPPPSVSPSSEERKRRSRSSLPSFFFFVLLRTGSLTLDSFLPHVMCAPSSFLPHVMCAPFSFH